MHQLKKTFWGMVELCISYTWQNQDARIGKKLTKVNINALTTTQKELLRTPLAEPKNKTFGPVARKNVKLKIPGNTICSFGFSLNHFIFKIASN